MMTAAPCPTCPSPVSCRSFAANALRRQLHALAYLCSADRRHGCARRADPAGGRASCSPPRAPLPATEAGSGRARSRRGSRPPSHPGARSPRECSRESWVLALIRDTRCFLCSSPDVAVTRLGRKVFLVLARHAFPLLGVRGRLLFGHDVGADRREFCVDTQPLLKPRLSVGLD